MRAARVLIAISLRVEVFVGAVLGYGLKYPAGIADTHLGGSGR